MSVSFLLFCRPFEETNLRTEEAANQRQRECIVISRICCICGEYRN